MDAKATIREFLISRRSRLSPADVGLPDFGSHRRVVGLRREEVAMLAGVSADYYIRLERGNLDGASDSVLNALARALQLDELETEYLFDLARTVRQKKQPAKSTNKALKPNLQLLLSSIESTPFFIRNHCSDILGANSLGRALYAPILSSHVAAGNFARFVFLDPAAKDFYVDYQKIAEDMVGSLRLESVRSENDPKFIQLLGELTAKSELFQQLWPNHRLMRHVGGQKSFNHPEVGLITLTYEPFSLVADDNLRMTMYTAEPGSDSVDKLALLGAWYASNLELQTQLSFVI